MDWADPSSCGSRKFRGVIDAPRWLFLVALVFAPWAYGCTRPWSAKMLSIILGGVFLLWAVGCALRRRWPKLPLVLSAAAFCLVAHGWWMAINAKSVFNPDLLVFIPRAASLYSHFGSVDGKLSIATMIEMTALLGALLFTVDLAGRSVWRQRVLCAMALTGLSIALFGIVQKIGGTHILSWTWEPEKLDIENNFALFRYRGNAGAYLNLILPLVIGFTFHAFRKGKGQWARAFWPSALVIVAAGIQLNPSRASWMIAALLTLSVVLLRCLRRFDSQEFGSRAFWKSAAFAAGGTASVALICSLGQWQTGWNRLTEAGLNPRDRSPTEIYLAMVPDAGILGFGPGTFRAAFPSYQVSYDFGNRKVPQFWKTDSWLQAHNDYLQCLIEWGYLGGLMWTVVIAGGLWRASAAVRTANQGKSNEEGAGEAMPSSRKRSDTLMLGCAIVAISGVLVHALVDFPLQIMSIQFYAVVLLGICWRETPRAPAAGSASE